MLVPNRVVLAPMAGLTSSAYRRHLKSHGVGLVVTEMVSSQGLLHGNVRTGDYLAFAESERPLSVQLFGGSAEIMARAAETVLSGARSAGHTGHQHGVSGAQGGQDRSRQCSAWRALAGRSRWLPR